MPRSIDFRKQGWSLKDINEFLQIWKLEAEYIREPQVESEWVILREAVARAKGRSWFGKNPYTIDRNSWFNEWYKHIWDHDPLPLLKRSKVPMLWIYGNRDSQSDFARNIALLHELKRDGKPFDIEVIPDVGHGLLGPVDEDGNEAVLLSTPESYLGTMLSWLQDR